MDEKITRTVEDQSGNFGGYMIFCPGCQEGHLFDKRWTFNDNFEKPTFSPSMRVGHPNDYKPMCHSVITDGVIYYQNDSGALPGQVVKLEPF